MFSTKVKIMAKTQDSTGVVNLIGVGTTIVGDVTSSGDIRIDGSLSGSVNTKGKVVVGTTGMVEGNVNASNADVSGAVSYTHLTLPTTPYV